MTKGILTALCLVALFSGFVILHPDNNTNESKNDYTRVSVSEDTVFLWNGKNLDGLELILRTKIPDIQSIYKIENGVLSFPGKQIGYFRTKEIFSNYKLHAEWRWPQQNENGNSGILVHIQTPDTVWPACIQVQYKKDNAGDLIAMNGMLLRETSGKPKDTAVKFKPSNEKPEGEWNTSDVICISDSMFIYINNLFQNKGTKCSFNKGSVGFQLEGNPIEFRNIYLIKK